MAPRDAAPEPVGRAGDARADTVQDPLTCAGTQSPPVPSKDFSWEDSSCCPPFSVDCTSMAVGLLSGNPKGCRPGLHTVPKAQDGREKGPWGGHGAGSRGDPVLAPCSRDSRTLVASSVSPHAVPAARPPVLSQLQEGCGPASPDEREAALRPELRESGVAEGLGTAETPG